MGTSALIGHTGFVGSNLASQIPFDSLFNSKNISSIRGRSFDLVVCAGIQAKKWWANQNAEADWAAIESLLEHLSTVSAKQFVLISTVDVYPVPSGVDEESPVDPLTNHAYGKNRFLAEEFARRHFPKCLILRLPGLFGTGIKKNVIHDFLHDHELEKINPAGVYQYYFLDRLRSDIEHARDLGLPLLNISAEPLSTREIMEEFFPEKSAGPETEFQAGYNMLSRHWKEWGSSAAGYLYDKKTVLAQLGKFIGRHRNGAGC
jgi:nucleoside-diphosphate-sugar epimerase